MGNSGLVMDILIENLIFWTIFPSVLDILGCGFVMMQTLWILLNHKIHLTTSKH